MSPDQPPHRRPSARPRPGTNRMVRGGIAARSSAGRTGVRRKRRAPLRRSSESGSGNTWLWLILIFVVGNIILVTTTGFIIIPR